MHSILSERHPEDRVVAIQRVIDLMLIFEDHRNLQGCQEAKAALFSAAVFRLKKAFNVIPPTLSLSALFSIPLTWWVCASGVDMGLPSPYQEDAASL